MSDFITLTCPSCGSRLQITSDMDRFACGYCGNEHVVRRSGGTISLAPVVEGLGRVERGVDRTASELAIARIEKEIDNLNYRIEWIKENGGGDSKQSIWMLLIGGGGGLLMLGNLISNGATSGIAAVSIPILFIVGFLGFRRLQKEQAEANARHTEIEELEGEIQRKEAELYRHQQIVNS